jgi:hypothetical protein
MQIRLAFGTLRVHPFGSLIVLAVMLFQTGTLTLMDYRHALCNARCCLGPLGSLFGEGEPV